MKYFNNITTEAAAKKKWIKLCQKYHPDKAGGNTEKFQEMKMEYENLLIYFTINKSIAVQSPEQQKQKKIKISKEYLDEIKEDVAKLTSTVAKTSMEMLFNKFFDTK